LQVLRSLYEDKAGTRKITHNFRPVQPINARDVKSRSVDRSFIHLTPSSWNYDSPKIGTYCLFIFNVKSNR